MLLGLFGALPRFALKTLLILIQPRKFWPRPIAAILRLLDVGLKGIVYTTYYGESSVMQQLHWDANVRSNVQGGDQRKEPPTFDITTIDRVWDQAVKHQAVLRAMSVEERLRYVARLKDVILARQNEIIDCVQRDTGKSRTDALVSEILSVLDNVAWLVSNATKVLADRKVHTPLALMGKKSQIWFEPLGTVLVISPWNYPFYQAVVPIISAFACGNTVVYKPSEFTPLTGLLEQVFADAGFDRAWVQVVYGDGATGERLIRKHPDKIFFTGSVKTGKKIMALASEYLIPVELELGGKDPMVVFEDANISRAAAGALWGGLTNTGQSCTSVERLFVQESIYESFRAELLKNARDLQQHVDQDGSADFGRMTTPFQVRIVKDQLDEARRQGATIHQAAWDGTSPMIPPAIVEQTPRDSQVAWEETFGPVIVLTPFRSEQEAIALANDSIYGLSASVWSADLKRAQRVARAIVTGNVSINNVMLTEGNPALPFGGTKQSGFGRYKGEFGLYSFSNIKSVIIDKNSAKIEANWYPYTPRKYNLFERLTLALFRGRKANIAKVAITGISLESYSAKVGRGGRAADPTIKQG